MCHMIPNSKQSPAKTKRVVVNFDFERVVDTWNEKNNHYLNYFTSRVISTGAKKNHTFHDRF